jgi:hypothetical protein
MAFETIQPHTQWYLQGPNHKISDRIVDIRVEIQTRNLRKTKRHVNHSPPTFQLLSLV